MTNEEIQKQLVSARRACLILLPYINNDHPAAMLGPDEREMVGDLLNQFARLDKKEQKQRMSGKKGAVFGKLGGRPKKA